MVIISAGYTAKRPVRRPKIHRRGERASKKAELRIRNRDKEKALKREGTRPGASKKEKGKIMKEKMDISDQRLRTAFDSCAPAHFDLSALPICVARAPAAPFARLFDHF